mgnify:CR=1 FL=1
MIIALGCDHGGFEHKNAILKHLEEKGFTVKDFGIYENVSVDYPDIAAKVCESIQNGECQLGILVCGTGIGMSIAANKIKGIRCALCPSKEIAALTKQHNNANVIALGGRFTSFEDAKDIVDSYMNATFEGGRHQRRVDQIMAIEAGTFEA